MLSAPFKGLPRGRLFFLLVLFLLLEAAGGAGLYVNNRSASAAPTPPPTPTRAAPKRTEVKVHNFPRTVVVGQSETFSARISDLANKQLTYIVAYPDGSVDKEIVQADVTGFSQQRFVIAYRPHDRREAIGIGVYYHGERRAFTQFAVQLPTRKPRP